MHHEVMAVAVDGPPLLGRLDHGRQLDHLPAATAIRYGNLIACTLSASSPSRVVLREISDVARPLDYDLAGIQGLGDPSAILREQALLAVLAQAG